MNNEEYDDSNYQYDISPEPIRPSSDIDFEYMTTNPDWGTDMIPPSLRNKLDTSDIYIGEDGNEYTKKSNLWSVLKMFNKEMRLANLSKSELLYCKHYIELASDCLTNNWPRSFTTAISRAATVLELSQSKGGFLRRQQHTVRQESINKDEPEKKGLFGSKKNKEE